MMVRIVLMLLALIALPAMADAQHPWKLEKDGDGVKVYSRQELGSPFRSFKAVTVTDASSRNVIEILKDIAGYSNWFAFAEKTRSLKDSPDERYMYMETRFPWPFHNGDMIYKMTFLPEADAITRVELTGLPDYIPSTTGVTRMKSAKGYISLKSMGNETEITYYMHSDPDDEIPVWMFNRYIYNLPYLTLKKLRETTSLFPSRNVSQIDGGRSVAVP